MKRIKYNYEQNLLKVNMAACITGMDGIITAVSKAAFENAGLYCGDDMKRYLTGDSDELISYLKGEISVSLPGILIESVPFVERCAAIHVSDSGEDFILWLLFFGLSLNCFPEFSESDYLFKQFIKALAEAPCKKLVERVPDSGALRKHESGSDVSAFLDILSPMRRLFSPETPIRNGMPLCEVNCAMEILRRVFLEYGCHTGFLTEIEVIGLSEEFIAESMTHISDEKYIRRWVSEDMPVLFTKYPSLERGFEALPDYLSGFPARDADGNTYSFFTDFPGFFSFVFVTALFAQSATDNGRVNFEIGMDAWHSDAVLIMTAEYKIHDTDNTTKSRRLKRLRLFGQYLKMLSNINIHSGFNYEVAFVPCNDGKTSVRLRTVMPAYAIKDSESGAARYDNNRPLNDCETALLRGASAMLEIFGTARTADPYPEKLIGK